MNPLGLPIRSFQSDVYRLLATEPQLALLSLISVFSELKAVASLQALAVLDGFADGKSLKSHTFIQQLQALLPHLETAELQRPLVHAAQLVPGQYYYSQNEQGEEGGHVEAIFVSDHIINFSWCIFLASLG